MKPLRLVCFLVAAATFSAGQTDGQTFVLESGDYRWVPLVIHQVPVQLEVSFQVSDGEGTVHMELLPETAFRPMQRGKPHSAMATTPESRSGTLRYAISEPGNYRVVVANRNGAKPATVRWVVSTDLSPETAATELSPRRRLLTIFVSFVLFFAMVGYSGWRLKRAIRDDPS